MVVTIPLSLVGGVTRGGDLHLLADANCTGEISEDNRFISISTNLTDCGTETKEYDTQIVYSNTVVERTTDSLISRLTEVFMPFSCGYNRSEHLGLDPYQITNYKLNSSKISTGRYEFSLDIFKDGNFRDKYADSEYPVDVDLNEELYLGASVLSQERSLDVSIKSCVATPSASFNDEQWTIIRDGCAVDTSTRIDDDAIGFVGVTIDAFRFVDLGNRVYIHCDLLVCQAIGEIGYSECNPACVGTSSNRHVRDVGEPSLHQRRIMRGPLRLKRSAHILSSHDMEDYNKIPVLHQTFNAWIVMIVTMAILCIILLGMIAGLILMQRITTYQQSQNMCPEEPHA
ncbi:ZP domain-containing protein-like [Lytechinus pictus]|uniref:ZP domain-containing protein-like n=1 Tax=Lytechinus pictus TaxID=7653 RepID=UPI0030B9FA21